MKRLLTAFYVRPLVSYLIVSLLALSSFAGPAEAMLIGASPAGPAQAASSPDRAADLSQVQKALESKVLQQRLSDLGLTPEETAARLDSLTDDQLHQLAANIDAVQAGGDIVGAVFALALIGALVVLIIFILQGRIAIERK